MADTNEMTINLVVLGKTQTGKSASGNSLLGSSDFESRRSPSSVTTCCSLGRSCRILGIMRRNGCKLALHVRVLDTPSYPHSALSKEQELLGPTWKDFTAVLLTHADKAEEAGCSEETYLHSASSTLLSLLSSVQHKYIFLDNQKSIIKEERTIVLRKLLNFIRQNNYQVLLLKNSKE
ncbi:GTPase IMAP family member GIMD1 isoform X2 [Manacus vitellinus]|uniref:GTPase IMAP family member GIMD1 isoform X2 n=1 Tax=Manacus vitellinus TaxID=328815 RepID=UPI000DF0DC3E|nr:GTPase IMAP family member GIMD1 isoform X2 [Manacus vitellinus]